MSAKVHLHMHVSDLAKSREFYAKFFGSGPVKEKPGYVKFLPEWAPVNLALSTGGPGGKGAVDHVGVQVDTPATVMAHLARVKAAELPVREEIGVDCCHANQDKFWVRDPDGVEWEVYHLNYDLEDAAPATGPVSLPVDSKAALKVATGGSSCCGGVSPREADPITQPVHRE